MQNGGVSITGGRDDGWNCGPDVMTILDSNAPHADRRRKQRIALTWTIHLTREGEAHSFEAVTKNVSTEGLYCIGEQAFRIGEIVQCVLCIPAFDPDSPNRKLALHCRARVVRVELAGMHQYGVALAIESYKVVTEKSRAAVNHTIPGPSV